MNVSEVMTRKVRIVSPNEKMRDAAALMAELDVGALPVAENEKLIGMITDRDIAVRAVAQGRGPDTAIRDVMTQDIKYVFDDQPVEEVCRNMAQIKVRRLPVVDRQKRLVGILSLGDLAVKTGDAEETGEALRGVSEPGGSHSQTGQQH